MFDKVVQSSLGALDRLFLLSAFLPTVLFAAAVGLTIQPSIVDSWNGRPGAQQIAIAAAFLAAALLAAALLANLSAPLTRFYEGYWRGPVGRRVARLGSAHHRSALYRLDRAGAYERVERGYPLPTKLDDVQPTTLGNVLRNAELHAHDRYGVDSVVIWPRLFPLLPDHVRAAIATARGELELLLNVCTLSALYGVVAGVHELAVGAPWWRFLLLFAGSMLLAWLAYLAAVAVSVAYGTQVKAIFDVYRKDLLDKIDPEAPEPDRLRWYRLEQLWYRAIPSDAILLPEEEPALPIPAPTPRRVPRLGVWFGLVVIVCALVCVLI